MSLLNFGAGIAALGASVAGTAGMAATEQMKSDLENQRLTLASQLAEGRESRLAGQQFGYNTQLKTQEGAQALERTNVEQTGATTRTNITEAGAEKRTTAEIAGRHEDVAAETGSAQKIAGMNIKAEADRLSQQLAVSKNEIGVDAEGNAIITDRTTGKATPVTDSKGNPVQVPNTAQSQAYMAAINATKSDLLDLGIRRGQDIKEATDELNRVMLPGGGNENNPDVVSAKKRLQAVKDQYEQAISDQRALLNATTKALLNRANLPKAADSVTGAPAGAKPGASKDNPVKPKSRQEAEALPKSTWFQDPSGAVIQRQ